MKTITALIFISFALSGCLATSKAITGPDGQQNQLIKCKAIEHCYEKASEVCHKGPYKIVDKTAEVESDMDGKPETKNTLLVKCENS